MAERDREVHAFPKGISPKVNVKAWLEFEPAYFEAAMLSSHHATETSSARMNLALNNPRGLICYPTKKPTNQFV